jgi:hypothetical protein
MRYVMKKFDLDNIDDYVVKKITEAKIFGTLFNIKKVTKIVVSQEATEKTFYFMNNSKVQTEWSVFDSGGFFIVLQREDAGKDYFEVEQYVANDGEELKKLKTIHRKYRDTDDHQVFFLELFDFYLDYIPRSKELLEIFNGEKWIEQVHSLDPMDNIDLFSDD